MPGLARSGEEDRVVACASELGDCILKVVRPMKPTACTLSILVCSTYHMVSRMVFDVAISKSRAEMDRSRRQRLVSLGTRPTRVERVHASPRLQTLESQPKTCAHAGRGIWISCLPDEIAIASLVHPILGCSYQRQAGTTSALPRCACFLVFAPHHGTDAIRILLPLFWALPFAPRHAVAYL